MRILFRDYETRSRLDLRDMGAWRYAAHPTTDVWCCAFVVDDGPIKLWVPGDPIPPEFVEAAQNPEWLVSAFNDQFERRIEQHIMGPRYGWPLIPIERHRCTQAAALALALPATLEKVASALKLEHQKDSAGHSAMLRMAKPRGGGGWFDDAERRARLYDYCKQDVATERALHRRIGELSSEEQALWVLDATINDRGIYLDGDLLDAAIRIAEAAQDAIAAELQAITDGAVTRINQTAKLIAWLAEHGCAVTDVQKVTLKKALTRSNLPPSVRRVMELRLDGAHAAAAKLLTMRNWRSVDGRARGTLRYHGASTGRWTSFGIQAQNMKRPLVEDIGAAIDAVATGDLDHLRQRYPQPMSVVGDITRALIRAAPGHRLIAADFSGIESRVTAWLSGQQSKLDQWAKFDQTQNPEDEPYFILGRTFGLPHEQARKIGKTADLAFGYMGSVGAWQKLAPAGDSTPEATVQKYKQTWRDAHPETERFWRALDRAAVKAVQKPGTVISCKKLAFKREGDFLHMHLPSGRKIAYPFPRLCTNDRGNCVVIFKDNQKGKFVDCRHGHGAYGGTWIENAVQAVARDLFAAAMPRLEAAGYPVTLHIHDEIVAEVPEGFGSKDEFLRIMLELPSWAEGLPMAAKVREGERFCKTEASRDVTAPADVIPSWQSAPEATTAPFDIVSPAPEDSTATFHPVPDDDIRGGNGYASGEREWGRKTAEYVYRDAEGKPYLRIVRTSAKQFPQYHRENGRWVIGAPKGAKIPYRLPGLLAAPPDTPIFVCEGEKDADNVAALGLVATTNSGGAGKWTADLNKWFAGKQSVYLLEDNDDAGRSHVAKIADMLRDIVPTIKVIAFPELPEKGDVSDWLAMGGTREELLARAKTAKTPPPSNGYTLVRASDVVPRALDWLWLGHLLRGSLELLTGLPGEGKSQIQCSIVASATTGSAWPDGTNGAPRGNVIMLTAEDCLDQTLVPRLIAAGAELNRVHILKKIRRDSKDRMFLLGEDLEMLAKIIADVGDVTLVTLDPITAYMGGKLDSHKTTDVRNQLGPLAELAERLDVAFSAITHPAKNAGSRSLDHFIGSQAFIAAARIGHLCVEEVEENEHGKRQPTGRRLFTNPKNNPHTKMPTIAYRVVSADGGTDRNTGAVISVSRIAWEETINMTADEALAAAAPRKDKDSGGPTVFLQDMLTNGPVPVKTIEERAEARGFSKDQLDRAKKKMGVVAFREGGVGKEGRWFWALPQHAPHDEPAA
jgi:DNA polymerase